MRQSRNISRRVQGIFKFARDGEFKKFEFFRGGGVVPGPPDPPLDPRMHLYLQSVNSKL